MKASQYDSSCPKVIFSFVNAKDWYIISKAIQVYAVY